MVRSVEFGGRLLMEIGPFGVPPDSELNFYADCV